MNTSFKSHLHPGMTQAQIDFYTDYIQNLSKIAFSDLKRKALYYFKQWNRYLKHDIPKDEYERYMIRYLHRQSQTEKKNE